jgi:hypothetical protein
MPSHAQASIQHYHTPTETTGTIGSILKTDSYPYLHYLMRYIKKEKRCDNADAQI